MRVAKGVSNVVDIPQSATRAAQMQLVNAEYLQSLGRAKQHIHALSSEKNDLEKKLSDVQATADASAEQIKSLQEELSAAQKRGKELVDDQIASDAKIAAMIEQIENSKGEAERYLQKFLGSRAFLNAGLAVSQNLWLHQIYRFYEDVAAAYPVRPEYFGVAFVGPKELTFDPNYYSACKWDAKNDFLVDEKGQKVVASCSRHTVKPTGVKYAYPSKYWPKEIPRTTSDKTSAQLLKDSSSVPVTPSSATPPVKPVGAFALSSHTVVSPSMVIVSKPSSGNVSMKDGTEKSGKKNGGGSC